MSQSPVSTAHLYAAWILAFVGMIIVLHFKLLTALITGLLVYQLVHLIAPYFSRHLPGMRARKLAIGLVVLVIVSAISGAAVGVSAFMHSEGGSFAALLTKMAEIIDSTRSTLPSWLADLLPRDVSALRERVSAWLREHSSELQVIGKETGHTAAHMLIGMVIGGMASLQESHLHDDLGPLGSALAERIARLAEAFRQVVFAQVRISALNTAFTTLYLAVALPLFGIHLPLTKTMIVVTFIAGLLPVVGNLISNTVIFVVSLAHSPAVATTSLAYLIIIHKLEYFLNARIVGAEISAKPWEILTAMLLMESIFGLAGLVAAPICYAWLKDELVTRRLI